MTDQHADAVPVITMGGRRLGYVYPLPGGIGHEHWGTVDRHGYESPFRHPTARDAAGRLAERRGLDPDDHMHTGLTAALARLGEEFGPLGVALAAAYLTDPVVLMDRLTRPRDPAPAAPAPVATPEVSAP